MISITCSTLEAVRQNPAAHGQFLATVTRKPGGGSHGMFACVQDVARLVHMGELTITQAIPELHLKFSRFIDAPQNKEKQDKLVEQFAKYCRQYDKHGFDFVDGWRLMKWDFTSDTRLTGRTPWVVANEKGYYSYVLSEKDIDWEAQLRFPLFQQYLVDNTVDCGLSDLQVGIYSFADSSFKFKNYSIKELKSAVTEIQSVLNTVYTEYKKKKK